MHFFGPSPPAKSYRVRAYLEHSFDLLYLRANGRHGEKFKCEFMCGFECEWGKEIVIARIEHELSDIMHAQSSV